jgi:hypothetical protein
MCTGSTMILSNVDTAAGLEQDGAKADAIAFKSR